MMIRKPDFSTRKNIGSGATKLRKGLWSPDEDDKLTNYMVKNGQGCWSDVARNAGLQRCGKSCRLRWINYLRPDLKRGAFSIQEEELIIQLHSMLGNRWSQIAAQLPGRTDNEIKNFWNSTIKKRLKNSPNSPSPNSNIDSSSFPEAVANGHLFEPAWHKQSIDTSPMFQHNLNIYNDGYFDAAATGAQIGVNGNGFYGGNGMENVSINENHYSETEYMMNDDVGGSFELDDKVEINMRGVENFWGGNDQELKIEGWEFEDLIDRKSVV